VLLVTDGSDRVPSGFRAYLLRGAAGVTHRDAYVLPPAFDYLRAGDVIRIDPQRRMLKTLYRRQSASNALLVTERCDNYCLMCSQPPKEADDSWLLEELVNEVVPLIAPDTGELGITGGEPALLGERLVRLLIALKERLPGTAVHMLTNGRRFCDQAFALSIARVAHPDLVLGIPLYSDLPEEHDYVVQARGAFDETVRGILNLKRAGVRVELRFVIHAETYERLPEFADFVGRNLLFVDHVALMGLEPTGFAKTNIERLWADPLDYQSQLANAVHRLARVGLNVSIYNLPLCVLPAQLRGYARKSISDWKNVYFDECSSCVRRDACAGFFASSTLKRSRGVTPFVSEREPAAGSAGHGE
jgi:His-Xaa-Ser system radical SAM maturase HxsC